MTAAKAGKAPSNASKGAMMVKCQRRHPAPIASPEQPPVLNPVYGTPSRLLNV